MNRVIERVLNLLAFLLSVGRPVTADEIRHTVAGYDQETDEAFRRTFERDKDLLRQLGVPMRMEHTDAWEVEQGYIVAPEEYALDDPGLTDEERTALWIAATMVRLGGQAAGPAAIFKLGGASALAAGEPLTADLGAEGESLAALFAAISERRRVGFTYKAKKRMLAPYGLAHRRGHWYVVGGTTDGVRVFRVDRMIDMTAGDTSGAFERPPGFRLRDELPDAPWTAGADDVVVEVAFDAEVAWWARRQVAAAASTITEGSDGGITVHLPVAQVDAFIGWLISFDDHAEILAPAEIRDRFVTHVVGS
ncbi:MAG: WYL domain-containing protein [Acidimicrobiia bacterium]